jgi:hypothetical protein
VIFASLVIGHFSGGTAQAQVIETEALREAERLCESLEPGKAPALLDAAYGGDRSALACIIANQRYTAVSANHSIKVDHHAAHWVHLGYVVESQTGAKLPEALAGAVHLSRIQVITSTNAAIAAMGGAEWGQIDEAGCYALTDIQIDLVRLARPDPVTSPCLARWGIGSEPAEAPIERPNRP